MTLLKRILSAGAVACFLFSAPAAAGPIFLTGHDPDFHSQSSAGAGSFFTTALDYVMGGQLNDDVHKLLWVESFLPANSGHLVGANGLVSIGLTAGQDYDWVDAAGFATADLSAYDAIGVASSFGGMLTSAELNALIARKSDIEAFINAGNGLFASAECEVATFSGCGGADNLAAPHGALFGFLPVSPSPVGTTPPYSLTPFGTSIGFDAAAIGYLNECCTHNSFGAADGLGIVDTDALGRPTTLAGDVRIETTGFVPEPTTMSLLALGVVGYAAKRARRRR
jgi:hypothetical protein